MTLIIVLIYIAFISLGLPDSMLGACWPVMHKDLHASLEFAGYIGMVVSFGTVISSLMANRILHKYGTAKAVYTSIFLTVVALAGISFAHNVWVLFLWAVPLGLGAGCIDSVLNNFVSLHLEAKHMNWLHCCWGFGALLGPGAVAAIIETENGWRHGYWGVGGLQFLIFLLIFVFAGKFTPFDQKSYGNKEDEHLVTNTEAIKIPYMKWNLFNWFCLCGGEIIGIAWTGTFIAIGKGFGAELGAVATSVYFASCTLSRVLSGMLSTKLSTYKIINLAIIVYILGCVILFLPLGVVGAFVGVALISIGNGPLYPCIMHETPNRFGEEYSGAVTGLQMAAAYTGSTLITVLFGWCANRFGLSLYYTGTSLFLIMFIYSFFHVQRGLGKLKVKKG